MHPFSSAKESFITKYCLLNDSIDFTHFSFNEQIENTLRRINLEEELNNLSNSENDQTSRYDQNEIFEAFSCMNDESDEQRSNDISFEDDLHMHSLACTMSLEEFHNSVKKLTLSQSKVLKFLKLKFQNKEFPFYMFISGGAGVGKTFLTKVIVAYLQLFCSKVSNSNPVLVCAPTGTAANNINGGTIHSMLKIPVCKYLQYNCLSGYSLKQLRKKFHNVHTVIIDEISMVSSSMLTFISRRLSEIKDNNLPFGGFNIITVGDFFQLRPVRGTYAFENVLLWHLFEPFFLSENMRQNGNCTYFSLLNRVRIGLPSKQDMECLKSRLCIESEELEFFFTNFSFETTS